jgi:hypothetical protein
MNKEQVENIDLILKEVNSNRRINKNDVYKMFKYREDAISTLHTLKNDGYINIIPIEEGDGIYVIMKTDKTFDGIGYYLRFLEEAEKPIETKTATKIATIISGLSKKLILQIVIPIIVVLIILIVWSLYETEILSWFQVVS